MSTPWSLVRNIISRCRFFTNSPFPCLLTKSLINYTFRLIWRKQNPNLCATSSNFTANCFGRSFVFCFLADVKTACFIHVVNMFYSCRQHVYLSRQHQACLATITLVACIHAHVRHFVLIETSLQNRGSPIHSPWRHDAKPA